MKYRPDHEACYKRLRRNIMNKALRNILAEFDRIEADKTKAPKNNDKTPWRGTGPLRGDNTKKP